MHTTTHYLMCVPPSMKSMLFTYQIRTFDLFFFQQIPVLWSLYNHTPSWHGKEATALESVSWFTGAEFAVWM